MSLIRFICWCVFVFLKIFFKYCCVLFLVIFSLVVVDLIWFLLISRVSNLVCEGVSWKRCCRVFWLIFLLELFGRLCCRWFWMESVWEMWGVRCCSNFCCCGLNFFDLFLCMNMVVLVLVLDFGSFKIMMCCVCIGKVVVLGWVGFFSNIVLVLMMVVRVFKNVFGLVLISVMV